MIVIGLGSNANQDILSHSGQRFAVGGALDPSQMTIANEAELIFAFDFWYPRINQLVLHVADANLGVSSNLNFGNVLVGNDARENLAVTNNGEAGSTLTGAIGPASAGEFTPDSENVNFSLAESATQTRSFTYTPTARGNDTGTVTVTSNDGNVARTLSGKGVAPVNQVTKLTDAGVTRIGTTSSAVVQVENVGDGNLSRLGEISNLRGTAGTSGGEFGGTGSLSLLDGEVTTLSFDYTPTGHGSDTGVAILDFENGSTDGRNLRQSLHLALSGTGVGPEFAAEIDGVSIGPSDSIDFGDVCSGDTATRLLSLGNSTADLGYADSLTGLTLLNVVFGGRDAGMFSLLGFTPGTVLSAGVWDDWTIKFRPTGDWGWKQASLTVFTDQNEAFGGDGERFTFRLHANHVPEPASLAVWGLLGALGIALHRWRRRRG
jgi:hypothetical protein